MEVSSGSMGGRSFGAGSKGGNDAPTIDMQAATCLLSGVADVFHALDDSTRRAILDELVERDGQTLFEICGRLTSRRGLNLSRQAISQHLGVLETAGLIHTEKRGRSKFHYFDPTPLGEIAERWPAHRKDLP